MIDVKRCELKYRTDAIRAADMQRRLRCVMREDAHNGPDGYLVRSLYFDTLSDVDFEEKVEGEDPRKKIRLRVYSPSDQTAKLEMKEKFGTNQRKRSLIVSRPEVERMLRGDYGFLYRREEEFAREIYLLMATRAYYPRCIVQYNRRAFMLEENDTRVTFDSRLCATEGVLNLFGDPLPLYPVCGLSEITLEVKYNGFLMTPVKNALGQNNGMQLSSSKYCRARMVSKHGRM